MTDAAFLQWVADRFVYVYGESPNVDFVLRLKRIQRTHQDAQDEWEDWLDDPR